MGLAWGAEAMTRSAKVERVAKTSFAPFAAFIPLSDQQLKHHSPAFADPSHHPSHPRGSGGPGAKDCEGSAKDEKGTFACSSFADLRREHQGQARVASQNAKAAKDGFLPQTFEGDASTAERLRDIAKRIRRLGVSGRCDPEAICGAKHDLADQVASIARELER